MRLRRALPTLLTVAATALGLAVAAPASPAAADGYSVEIGTPDTSTPGHVRATVTTDAPYVTSWVGLYVSSDQRQTVPVSGGSVDLDRLSWGHSGETQLWVQGCASAWSCDAPVSVTFTPTDAAPPQVTWSELTQIGTSSPPYAVAVSDPEGDGSQLVARYAARSEELTRGATTSLQLDQDFSGSIAVWRCDFHFHCTDTGVRSPEVTVNKVLTIGGGLSHWGPVSPKPDDTPDVVATLTPDEPGDYALDWGVSRSTIGGQAVPVTGGPESPIEVPIDLSAAPDGRRTLSFTLSRDIEGFGPVTETVLMSVMVDSRPPTAVVEVDKPTFYPERDGYLDTLRVVLLRKSAYKDTAVLDVFDADGERVRRIRGTYASDPVQVSWHGITDDGAPAPAGRYTLRSTVTDEAGNSSVATGWVTLSRKRVVEHKFQKTLPAARTLADTLVGPCSRLAKPSARGITGSLGLYTNVRCDKGVEKSLVITVHAVRMPRALEYGDLRLKVLGGAARSMPGSRAYLDMRDRRGRWQSEDTLLDDEFGRTVVWRRQGGSAIRDDRWLVWAVYTGAGARYDLANFTIALKYKTLV